MDINVLNSDFKKIAIVDYYTSLMWCKRFNAVGAIDLQIEATTETLNLFKRGRYITRDDDDGVYRIEAVELDTTSEGDNQLIVGAYDCKQILKQRIIWDTIYKFSGTAENFIRLIIQNNVISPTASNPNTPAIDPAIRKISNFRLKDAHGFIETDEEFQQTEYENVADKIIEVCEKHGYGWRITLEDGLFYFDLYKGVDHSIDSDKPVVFSPENENLFSSKYTMDASEYKNACLVGGEGDGKAKILTSYGTASGLDRFETYVDAGSTSTNDEESMSTAEYKRVLANLGKEALADTSVVETFEGSVDTMESYKYKDDYDLGDIVTIKNEYGIEADARITEIIETWDNEGYTLEPTFEYMEVSVNEATDAYILTEDAIPLSTQDGVKLVAENSATVSSDSVRISELPPVDTIFDGCCFPIVQEGETKKVYASTLKEVFKGEKGDDGITPSMMINSEGHLIAFYDDSDRNPFD